MLGSRLRTPGRRLSSHPISVSRCPRGTVHVHTRPKKGGVEARLGLSSFASGHPEDELGSLAPPGAVLARRAAAARGQGVGVHRPPHARWRGARLGARAGAALRAHSWLKPPSNLSEDTGPSASVDHLKAQAAPTRPRAPPEHHGRSPWPRQPASGRDPKVEHLALSARTGRTTQARPSTRAGCSSAPSWTKRTGGRASCGRRCDPALAAAAAPLTHHDQPSAFGKAGCPPPRGGIPICRSTAWRD